MFLSDILDRSDCFGQQNPMFSYGATMQRAGSQFGATTGGGSSEESPETQAQRAWDPVLWMSCWWL